MRRRALLACPSVLQAASPRGINLSAVALEAPFLRRKGAHLTAVITQTFTNARVVPLGAVILMAYSIQLEICQS